MYPITIKLDAQEIEYKRKVELKSEELTLADLREHVSETEKFTITFDQFWSGDLPILYIRGKRLETAEEVKIRVAKEEQYMINYTIFQANKNKK